MRFDNSLSVPSGSMAARTNMMSSLLIAANPQAQEKIFQEISAAVRPRAALDRREIHWRCHQFVIGSSAYGRLPVRQGVQREAERHNVKLLVLLTTEAIEVLKREGEWASGTQTWLPHSHSGLAD
jgi:hypothetical protein